MFRFIEKGGGIMTVYNFLIDLFTNDIDSLASFIAALSNSGEYTCIYCQYYYERLNSSDNDCDNDWDNYCKRNCTKGVKKWLQNNNKDYINDIAKEIDFGKQDLQSEE